MSRPILLSAFIVTSLAAFVPAAFSAAVVRTENTFLTSPTITGKTTRWLEFDRLATNKGEVLSTSLSLESHRVGSRMTLIGDFAVAQDREVVLAVELANRVSGEETAFAVSVPNLSAEPAVASAPTAAPVENIGSASQFATVPEPTAVSLIALGALAFLRRRRA